MMYGSSAVIADRSIWNMHKNMHKNESLTIRVQSTAL